VVNSRRRLRKNYKSTDSISFCAGIFLELYKIYDNHRDAILWFLEELDANSYEEYLEKYSGTSAERSNFVTVCGFFELSGVLVSNNMIDENIYFDIFNPAPFWDKARLVIEGMRYKRPHIYEKFELLNRNRLAWSQKRERQKPFRKARI
jgi:hypothetical protein